LKETSAQKAIAVGVDDDGRVWKSHFGMAPWYYIFNRQGLLVERRPNPYAQGGKDHGDPTAVAAMLPECGTFLARRMGKKSRQRLTEEMGVTTVLSETSDPRQAVIKYLATR